MDLRLLVGALVALAVGVFLVTALFGLFNPRDTSQPEGAVVAGGRSPWQSAQGAPYAENEHIGSPAVASRQAPDATAAGRAVAARDRGDLGGHRP